MACFNRMYRFIPANPGLTGHAMAQMFRPPRDVIGPPRCVEVWARSTEVRGISPCLLCAIHKLKPRPGLLWRGLVHQIGVLRFLSYAEETDQVYWRLSQS